MQVQCLMGRVQAEAEIETNNNKQCMGIDQQLSASKFDSTNSCRVCDRLNYTARDVTHDSTQSQPATIRCVTHLSRWGCFVLGKNLLQNLRAQLAL